MSVETDRPNVPLEIAIHSHQIYPVEQIEELKAELQIPLFPQSPNFAPYKGVFLYRQFN